MIVAHRSVCVVLQVRHWWQCKEYRWLNPWYKSCVRCTHVFAKFSLFEFFLGLLELNLLFFHNWPIFDLCPPECFFCCFQQYFFQCGVHLFLLAILFKIYDHWMKCCWVLMRIIGFNWNIMYKYAILNTLFIVRLNLELASRVHSSEENNRLLRSYLCWN